MNSSSITSGGGSFTLTPDATRKVIVWFSPSSTGTKSATLRFQNDDPDENPLDVVLSGNGTPVSDVDGIKQLPMFYNLYQNYPNPL